MIRALFGAGIIAASSWFAPAFAQDFRPTIPPVDFPAVMTAYVDGVVELRQFIIACGPGDPPRWDEGAEMLIASLTNFGFLAASSAEFRARLAGSSADAVRYDCAGEVAKLRAEIQFAPDWVAYHSEMLKRLGIAIVTPPANDDPRLAALHEVIARHVGPQARLLNCMALTMPDFFTTGYGDWNTLVDQSADIIRTAGYDAATAAEAVGPARPARLMRPVTDRQAAIADCMTETDWMTRSSTFQIFALTGDVREALGLPR